MPDDDSAEYGLVCPFLDRDPRYAHGVEFGMLAERMHSVDAVDDYFLLDNQEQILLLANRTGWKVESAEPIETPGWFRLVMNKLTDGPLGV